MSIVEGLRVIGMVLGCQVFAPIMMLNLPAFRKIRVESIKNRTARLDNKIIHSSPDGSKITYFVHPESPGHKTILSLEDKHGKGFVLVDEDGEISSSSPSSWYVESNGGSGDLGVALFGMPGIIVTSPILILNAIIWYLIEQSAGMDRHALSFYLRVRGQLDGHTRYLLKKALKQLTVARQAPINQRDSHT